MCCYGPTRMLRPARERVQAWGWSSILCLVILTATLPSSANATLGDITGDGSVTAVDLQLVINHVLGIETGYPLEALDINNDGAVNALDIQIIINIILGLPVDDFIDDDTLPPLDVEITLDEAKSATEVFTPEGGVLETTTDDGVHFRLTLPEDALAGPTAITLTPASVIEGFPFSGGIKAAAHLEPSGLPLFAPATLEITNGEPPPPGQAAGFAYYGDGESFHLRPIEYVNGTAAFALPHLSSAGHGQAEPEEREEHRGRETAAEYQDLMQELAEALEAYREAEQSGAAKSEDEPGEELQALWEANFSLLEAHFSGHVRPAVVTAQNDRATLYCALEAFRFWRNLFHSKMGLVGPQHLPLLLTMEEEAMTHLATGFTNAVQMVYLECLGGDGLRHAAEMMAWHQFYHNLVLTAEVSGLPPLSTDIENMLRSCLRFDLHFEASVTTAEVLLGAEASAPFPIPLELESLPDTFNPFDAPEAQISGLRIEGEGVIEYDSIDFDCFVSVTFTPGEMRVAAYVDLPAWNVRQCPATPSWDQPRFRVRLGPHQPPLSTLTLQCEGDDEPFTLPTAPFWHGSWAFANQYRIGMGFEFDEWTVFPTGGNPIAQLNEFDMAEDIQAVTKMELWHTPQ